MARYNYAHEWMEYHWGHIKNRIITEWQALSYVAAMMTYHNANKQARKKLREELAGEH